MTQDERTGEPLDVEWAALRDGLSKAYTAKDIDAALATARPKIEAAAAPSQPVPSGLDEKRLALAMFRTAPQTGMTGIKSDIAVIVAREYARLAATTAPAAEEKG